MDSDRNGDGGYIMRVDESDFTWAFCPDEDGEAAVLESCLNANLAYFKLADEPETARHLCMTGQDFATIFGVGNDADQIAEYDALGVCLACIRALLRRVRALESA
jgi:hypothetical protein